MENTVKKYTVDDLQSGDPMVQTEAACLLSLESFSRQDIFKFLQSGNPELVSFGILHLEGVKTKDEAFILAGCLKYEDSRITDPASTLIKNIINDPQTKELFLQKEIICILIDSIMVSNPRVCRNAGEILSNFKSIDIVNKITEVTLDKLKDNDIYALYWGLFALELSVSAISKDLNNEKLVELIKETSNSGEYQIRERTAYLLKALKQTIPDEILDGIFKKFKNDKNFYVKNSMVLQQGLMTLS